MISVFKRAPILVAAALSLILSAFVALPAVSQDTPQELSPEHLALAKQYVELTDKSGIYETTIVTAGIQTYKQLLPQNPEIADPLNVAIEAVIATYKERKNELIDQFARVYALQFTQEELQQIVDFYSSPVGQKLAGSNAQTNQRINRVMNLFRYNLANEFFAKVRAELKAKGIDV